MEKVSLQLRWDHQFQFAGYYAALWQGYYEDAGLDVEIRPAARASAGVLSAVEEVQEGRADFGIGAADIFVANEKGAELVVLASVFQKSAAAYYSMAAVPLDSPESLLALRVERRIGDLIDIELQAMLRTNGIPSEKVAAHPYVPGINNLLSNNVDVISGYSIATPLEALGQGVLLNELNPSDHGVDFYGDSIFTSSDTVLRSPELVSRFKKASLLGWQYALDNIDEMAYLIDTQLDRVVPIPENLVGSYNLLQAYKIEALTLYPTVELGRINPDRWSRMHATLREAGLVSGQFDPDALFVLPDDEDHRYMDWIRAWGHEFVILIVGVVLVVTLWSRELKLRVARAQIAYDASEQRFRATFEQAPIGIAHAGIDGRLIRVNQTFANSSGYPIDELKGMYVGDFMRPEEQGEEVAIIEKLISGELVTHNVERRYRRKDGSFFWGALTASTANDLSGHEPLYFIIVIKDISKRKAAEQEQEELRQVLQQTQRLDSLGKLTGGIAHDVNNTLGLMLGNLQLARQFSNQLTPEEITAYLQSAEDAGNQGRQLVEQLLIFARGGVGERQQVQLESLVHEGARLFKSNLKPEIELTVACQSDLPPVMVDPLQFQQVLMNLLINARDAIEGAGAIEVRVDKLSHTEPCPFTPDRSSCRGVLLHGVAVKDSSGCALCRNNIGKETFVVVSVIDTGTGIAEQDLNYVFDPFFTTKAKAKANGSTEGTGHGLGLSVVHGIIESSGGRILIDTELGVGTSIRVLFPCAELPDSPKLVPEYSKPSQTPTEEGAVMVVDDELGIVEYVSRAFSMSGHKVLSEVDSLRALEHLQLNNPPISLLITDYRMPNMTGMQLAKAAKEINPDLPVILCSGYADEINLVEMEAMGIHFFNKPVGIDQLLETAAEVLDGQ